MLGQRSLLKNHHRHRTSPMSSTAALVPSHLWIVMLVTPTSSFIQNSQPAIAVNGVMQAAKHIVHQPVSRSVGFRKTLPRMSLPTETGISAAVKLTRIGWTL